MTLNGAIKQLHELRFAEDMPIYYKLVIAEVINVLLMDTQEVKHGKWNTVVNSNNHITYYCPICGSIFNKGCADLGDYNYCPNCGAKMSERR